MTEVLDTSMPTKVKLTNHRTLATKGMENIAVLGQSKAQKILGSFPFNPLYLVQGKVLHDNSNYILYSPISLLSSWVLNWLEHQDALQVHPLLLHTKSSFQYCLRFCIKEPDPILILEMNNCYHEEILKNGNHRINVICP